jgi:dihydrolipoamide dehydrogenase
MSIDVKIVSQGVGMTEAVLHTWLKQPGEAVSKGEPIVEIETDKTTVEIEAPADGRMGAHLVAEGDIVEVGTTIVVIE